MRSFFCLLPCFSRWVRRLIAIIITVFVIMITSKITENCEIPYKDYGLLPATAERVYKLYLWEDLQTAKPLCEAEICS